MFLFDIARAGTQRNSAAAVYAAYVAAGNSHNGGFDRHVGDAFGFLERMAYGAYRGIQIYDESLARTFGLGRTHSEEARASVFNICYQRARFGTANIQGSQIAFFLAHEVLLRLDERRAPTAPEERTTA